MWFNILFMMFFFMSSLYWGPEDMGMESVCPNMNIPDHMVLFAAGFCFQFAVFFIKCGTFSGNRRHMKPSLKRFLKLWDGWDGNYFAMWMLAALSAGMCLHAVLFSGWKDNKMCFPPACFAVLCTGMMAGYVVCLYLWRRRFL